MAKPSRGLPFSALKWTSPSANSPEERPNLHELDKFLSIYALAGLQSTGYFLILVGALMALKNVRIWLLCGCILFVAGFTHAAPGLSNASPIAPFLDGALPSTSPGASSSTTWVQVDYYPDLTFVEPIRIIEHPVLDRLLIIGKDGIGWTVSHEPGATDAQEFFNIQPIMHGKSGVGEGGISDLAFHPEFGQAGSPNAAYVYITYRWSPTQSGTFTQSPTVDGFDRLSRFSVVNGQVDLSTELVMMSQYDRQQWHLGGDMFFGDDGFLYISRGDEGNCCDRTFNTQRLDGGLWSGILRIDVDQDPTRSHPIRRQPTHLEEDPQDNGPQWPASSTQNYFIPNDNPFVDEGGANLEEFYSLGLRHPFTIAFDSVSGNIWVADVGQASREEIDIVRPGDNHQWGYREGNVAGVIPEPSVIVGNPTPPIWDYDRDAGRAVIGAGVYRGDQFPELFGRYLFSDFVTGRLWTATSTGTSYTIEQIGEVTAGFPNGVNGYLLDSKGNVLIARTAGGLNPNGRIQMLVRASDVSVAEEPPALLSQTGAFTDLQSLTPNPACIPYELNVPFWSDAALKSRWMCVPNDGAHDSSDEQIAFSAEGDWRFPVGAVLVKHFELQTDSTDPNARVRLETRFIVQGEDGHYGVTYRWNDEGTEAFLLTDAETRTVTIQEPQGARQQVWEFPSRGDCLTCHANESTAVLGPKTRQLNRDNFYPLTGATANQLETLNALGMLSPGIDDSQLASFLDNVLTSTPTADDTASLTERARSYLDANCANCHRPAGVRANFDARLSTPLSAQGLINGELVESLGIDGEAVIVPGSLSQSILFHRAASVGESVSMPPIAKNLVDQAGVAVLAQWIQSLGGFTLGNDTSTGGNFIDGHHPSLYINESDTYTQGAEPGTIRAETFQFFAQRLGNPVTPLLVRVDGDNQFTVVAIGTTRTQDQYQVGANSFAFSDVATPELQLQPGDRIGIGFMDSFPDGSGWGAGTVIPATSNGGSDQDEIWALLPNAPLILQTAGFDAGRDTANIALNENPVQTNSGRAVRQLTQLRRSYKIAVGFGSAGDDSSGAGGGSTEVPQPENGSFEQPGVSTFTIFSDPTAIPGWTITSGTVEVDRTPWPAAEGLQSMDLAGSVAGSLEQRIVGFQAGARYQLQLSYGLHINANSSRSAEVLIDGGVAQTLVAGVGMLVPNYQAANIEFVAPASGEVVIGFNSLSPDSRGVVIDDVRIALLEATAPDRDGDGVPDAQDAFPDDPSESADSDGDGVGNNADEFPNDSGETQDTDGDGIGDNADPFPNDPTNTDPNDNSGLAGVGLVLGNSASSDRSQLDVRMSNLVIDESDSFTNTTQDALVARLQTFRFFAADNNAPVTPFVVKVVGDNDFVVVAVGDTRTDFPLGSNSVSFADALNVEVRVEPGETIAVGFLDANADGSGSAEGSVVPYDNNGGEIWYSGGPTSGASAAVVLNQAPIAGNLTLLDVQRDYAFNITFAMSVTGNDAEAGFCLNGAPNLLVNGSFEDTSNPNFDSTEALIRALGRTGAGSMFLDRHPDSDFPGWFTTGGIALQQGGFSQGGTIEVGLSGFLGADAPDGIVFAELDGNGHNQLVSVTPGQTLDWELSYRGREGSDSATVSIGPVGAVEVIATIRSPNTGWVTHRGDYQVPDSVSEIQFVISPLTASNGDIDSSNLLDDVKLCGLANPGDGSPGPVDPGNRFVQSSAAGNLLVVEAESFATNTPRGVHSWELSVANSASAGNAMESTPNVRTNNSTNYATTSPRLDYEVNFVTAGTHYVWVRGLGPNAGGDSVHVGLDGVDLLSSRRFDDFEVGSFDWSGDIQVAGVLQRATIEVASAGNRTLNVWMREDGFVIDRVLLTTDANFVPQGIGPVESSRGTGAGNGGGTGGNTAPTIAQPADQTSELDSTANLSLTATDADGDSVSFSATGLPAGLSINSATGLISGTPNTAATFSPIITVADGNGGSASVGFSWTVTAASEPGDRFLQSSGAANLLVVEAENFSANTPRGIHRWEFSDANAASAGGAMESTPNARTNNSTNYAAASPRLDFDVSFVTPGTHYVWVRGFGPNTGGDSVHVGLDGVDLLSSRRFAGFEVGSFDWSGDIQVAGVLQRATIEVASAGNRTLNVWMREDGFVIDRVLLTTDANFVPQGAGPVESSRGAGSGAGGGNTAPSIARPTDQETALGSSVSLQLQAADDDGDALSFSAAGLPTGLSIDSVSGLISGAPESPAVFAPVITVTDGNGGSATVGFSWLVSAVGNPGNRFLQSNGVGNFLTVEAENFSSNTAQGAHNYSPVADSAASGGSSMRAAPEMRVNNSVDYLTSSPRLDFEATFVTAGTHYVWVRGFSPNTGGDSVHVGLNGVDLLSSRRLDDFTIRSLDWSSDIQVAPGVLQRATIEVPSAGDHTLNIWMREDGFEVDKLFLTTDPDFVPTGVGPDESVR